MVHIIFLLNRVIINKCCKNLQEERNNELEQSPKEMELLITNDVKSTQTSLFTHTHIQREGQVGEGIGSHNWEVYGVFWDCRQPSHPPCQKNRVKTGRILMMLFESQIHNILGKPGKQEKKKKKESLFLQLQYKFPREDPTWPGHTCGWERPEHCDLQLNQSHTERGHDSLAEPEERKQESVCGRQKPQLLCPLQLDYTHVNIS